MITIDKSQEWEQLEQHFAHVIDGLGKKIDQGIMDAVIACNAVGVNTTASCEGHLDWGNANPWIRVGIPGVTDLENEQRRALKAWQNADQDDKPRLYDEYYAVTSRVQKLHVQEELKLTKYLDAFYKQHEMNYDRHLVITRTISGECILQSHGADLQDIREPDEKAAKLKEYQGEMQAFADFLKRRFFGEDSAKQEYPVSQAADLLGMRHRTLTAHIERGNLIATRKGRDFYISAEELARFKNRPRKVGRPAKV